jgi:hypothetical protein
MSHLLFRQHVTAQLFPLLVPLSFSIPNHCTTTARLTNSLPPRQLAIQQVPDIVSGLFLDINAAVDKLGTVLNKATNSLGCPNLNNISKSEFKDYPGFTKS